MPVCLSMLPQAGVYPNFFSAASSIVAAAGPRGLFTGYLPTLLEDVPDMAFKFAAYESLRELHKRLKNGRSASAQVGRQTGFGRADPRL
jgi:solute carrier family 25 (mitochondrial S-adenosylmethionine transporter), member 26